MIIFLFLKLIIELNSPDESRLWNQRPKLALLRGVAARFQPEPPQHRNRLKAFIMKQAL